MFIVHKILCFLPPSLTVEFVRNVPNTQAAVAEEALVEEVDGIVVDATSSATKAEGRGQRRSSGTSFTKRRA